ncbi:MAG: amino acid ABC transporter permease, partial [Rhodobacteraceae bacterium]|nr:amino acid ABC transporter permease [Paracoccaceae bacterium]MCB2142544.1 amino acid ABC transporter permease [Paracoccaceae bacterium]
FAGSLKDVSGGTIDMPNVMRGVIAIAIGYSAYLAEIFRAGIDAVAKGQIEAARSLGLNNYKVARLVVLPQAFRIVLPALGNEFIAILKDTSLLSILSVRDVTQRMREFQSASFLPFAPFNSAAILYVFLTLAAASLIASIERRFDVKKH